MDDKAAKASLKTAKESITSDPKTAKSLCLSVLTSTNVSSVLRFNALLLVALAHQNLGEAKEAEAKYRLAAAENPVSPMPWNGLVALFEKTKDDDALADALKSLRAVLSQASPIDAKKYAQVSFKLLALLDTQEYWIESMNVLESLLDAVIDPLSTNYSPELNTEIASHISSSGESSTPQIYLLSRLITVQETHDKETMDREVELRRRRLGAADLATTRRIVESEVVQKSKLHDYYPQLIDLISETDAELVRQLKVKLLTFLSKKIKHIADGDKKANVVAQMQTLSEDVISDGNDSLEKDSVVAFEFLMGTSDCLFDDYSLELLTQASTAFPYSPIGLAASGYIKAKSPEYTIDEALDDLNESYEKDPLSLFTVHSLAKLSFLSRDFDSCIVYSKKASSLLAQVRTEYGIELNLVELSIDSTLSKAYVSIGPKCHQDAVTLYRKLIDRDPNNLDALYGLATAYGVVDKHQEALGYLHQVLEHDSENLDAISDIGWTLFQSRGGLDEALEWTVRALDMIDCAKTRFRLGKVQWALERKDEAYTNFLAAVKMDSTIPGAFTAIGNFCLEVDGNRGRAKKCFEKGLEVDPKDEEAVVGLVKLMLEDGDVESAKNVLIEFSGLSSRSAVVWRYLGFIALQSNDFVDSITYFQTSLRLDTKSVASWEGLGESYAEEGKYMAALKAFKRAFELDPTRLFSVYQSGHIKMKLGLQKDAITDFRLVEAAINDGTASGFAIPCWKSMAECYLASARDEFAGGAYGVCVDNLNFAVNYCLKVVQSGNGNGYQSIFKILGDACMAFYVYRSSHTSRLLDLGAVQQGLQLLGCDVSSEYGMVLALELSIASYKVAIHICGQLDDFASLNSAYLHDLAMSYHYLHEFNLEKGTGTDEKYLKLCLASMWKALQADPNNEHLWNSLGVFALRVNSKTAQHAFIKAAEFNEKISDPWTNLGYFYYFNGDLDLAKQSFSRAQLIDPENCLSWYGQALINTVTNTSESLDLFDHANDLAQGQNLEVCYSYALSEYQRFVSGNLDQSVLTAPVFSMLKFCEICVNDASGFTLLGLLREQQGVWEEAVKVFGRAVEILRESNTGLGEALKNYARSLCSAGLYGDSIAVYDEVFAAEDASDDVLARVGFGVALFFEGRLEDSLTCFQDGLNMLAAAKDADVLVQNKVGLLLSQVLYALGTDVHVGLARDQLMECVQRPGGFPRALISLLALGIVSGNSDLAQGAAAELIKVKPDDLVGSEEDRNVILSRYFLLQGASKLSRGFLAKNIHQTPWKARNWLLLAENISRHAPEIQDPLITVAKSASVLQHSHTQLAPISGHENASIYQSLGHALLTRYTANKTQSVRSCFHSAVRAKPSNARMWLSLGLHLRSTSSGDDLSTPETTDEVFKATENVCQTIVSLADVTPYEVSWANLLLADANIVRGLAFMALGHEDTARQILQGALEVTESARLDSECPDRRVMAMGYAVGARALYAMGDEATAFGAYRNAVMCVPEFVQLWEELAEAYTNSGRFPQAISSLIAALSSITTDVEKAIVLARLSKVYLMVENGEESSAAVSQLKALEAGVTQSPNNRLLSCVSMLKFGNAGALSRAKKTVAAVLGEENDCGWALWLSEKFNLQ
ncbi:TPR-like protein [Rhizoclosmatium globosum]|uniref:TPR-like protein n=1 Tax=Rhizoclosmatium globosum TaxID=329046 RepID=A0A1Y2C3H3_9FUNG|nr:TPR-like protein [Rhizoclosmatium globosum]|eukprot:ORY41579.1 TPR-like protein [Rhizoclosmatium globosum]